MKSSAVLLAAACASLASAMPSYRFGNWNSTVVNYNSTTPASWNSTSSTTSTTSSSDAAWSTATGVVAPISTGLPQSEAAAVPPAAPYWSNQTTTTAVSNETWVSRNETRFQPSQTHQPVPLIRRFRPQRKTSRALY